ncbi:PIN domain-containing protein [Massilia rubra]|uniref:Ribonuclease VapC n=1 Tax=Massilia rubra TaxID=2607910 RepID=A0ABX0LQ07_9BURK|nr:PIN domain-containing protein [Massilia rubra]NHZ36824.1 type II toxin-antitoxin system VapC family toxin [Massilia rubra]
MALILFDTNIFIDMLNGVHQASIELASYDMPAISYITYMELRVGEIVRPHEKSILDAVLDEFQVVNMSKTIMEAAIKIRGSSLVNGPAIKLPDAIIAATAWARGCPVVTRNAKDFLTAGVTVHVPYDYDSTNGIVTNVRAPIKLVPKSGGPTMTRIR